MRQPRRRPRSATYVDYFETGTRAARKGSFRLGREKFEQKFALEEGFTLGADRLLDIAMRELQATQEEFRRVASRLNGGDPVAAWQKTKSEHPPAGKLVAVAAAAGRRAGRVHHPRGHHHAPRRRAGLGRADAAVLPLDVGQHVDARPIRGAAAPRDLLHH